MSHRQFQRGNSDSFQLKTLGCFSKVPTEFSVLYRYRKLDDSHPTYLDDLERLRANEYRCHKTGREFVFGRSFLRSTLATELGLDPQEIILETGKFGKPKIARFQNPHGLEFNISKSGRHFVIAMSYQTPVGIDIEDLDRREKILDCCDYFLTTNELRMVKDSADPATLALHIWTAKESYLKCLGIGLHREPSAFEIVWKGAEKTIFSCIDSDGIIEGIRLVHPAPVSIAIAYRRSQKIEIDI